MTALIFSEALVNILDAVAGGRSISLLVTVLAQVLLHRRYIHRLTRLRDLSGIRLLLITEWRLAGHQLGLILLKNLRWRTWRLPEGLLAYAQFVVVVLAWAASASLF